MEGHGTGRVSPHFDEGVALAELLAGLPHDRREAFVLTRLLGLPYAEAARLTDCPAGTIRSRVARARTSLQEQLHAAVQELWDEEVSGVDGAELHVVRADVEDPGGAVRPGEDPCRPFRNR